MYVYVCRRAGIFAHVCKWNLSWKPLFAAQDGSRSRLKIYLHDWDDLGLYLAARAQPICISR